jgi:PIN domain nuclease of toxin-antitoxin system
LIHLDTHVVAWLYAGEVTLFPRLARERLETSELRISPMVVLELQYLFELGRTRASAGEVVAELGRSLGLAVATTSFAAVAAAALSLDFTRDPFDRLIVAHAISEDAPLLTRDGTLLGAYPRAFWDRA